MSLSASKVQQLKSNKRNVVLSSESSTAGKLFKYLGGDSLVYRNVTLEHNENYSQLFQNNSTMYVKSDFISMKPLNTIINSKGLLGTQGFTVGDNVDKDMDTTGADNLEAAYAPNNIAITGGPQATYWDDWDDDIFDDWGFFYIFNVSTNQYFFPLLQQINLADETLATETFSAFGKTFTITHGYPAQGIYKFDISCSDPSFTFIFGAYGDMGSDSNTLNTNFTQSYTLNNNTYTLYYNRNIEVGDLTERFFSYFIPYDSSLNNTKTYTDFLKDSDELSLFSVPLTKGLTVYFAKKNDVKDWVINDLTINSNNYILSVQGNTAVGGSLISKTNLLNLLDEDFTSNMTTLTNSYFTSSTLTNHRNFIIPSATTIIDTIPHCIVGSSFTFTINNVQANNYNRYLVGEDASISLAGCYQTYIAQNQIITYQAIVTNINTGTEAVTIVQL